LSHHINTVSSHIDITLRHRIILHHSITIMSSNAPSAAANIAWNDLFRRGVVSRVWQQIASDADKQKQVAQACNLQQETFDDESALHSAVAPSWYTASADLDVLLRALSSTGTYPLSATSFRWDWNGAEIESLAQEVMTRAKSVIDKVSALKAGEHTFANTLQALSDNDRIVDVWSGNVTFMSHVSPSKAIRDVCSNMEKVLSEFEVAQSMRVDLFRSIQAFSQTSESKQLSGESARLLEFTLRDFRRAGLDLPDEKRTRVEEIKKRCATLGIEFSKNLGEENTQFEFTKEELMGVSEDTMARFSKNGDKYIVSLKYPDYLPTMEQCRVEETRQKLEYAFSRRCIETNTPILHELVKLRAEQAALLGYRDHASYQTEIRMAKNPETVIPFMSGLSKKLEPLMAEELAYWRELKAEELKALGKAVPAEGTQAITINPWDMRFYIKKSELMKYKIDDQLIRKYFPLEVVTKGLLEIYQRVLGWQFTELKDRPAHAVWHEDVRLFHVRGASSGQEVGYFFLDLHPREGKYGHAAVWGLRPGCAKGQDGERQLPVAACVCNFTKPTANSPSLLQHSEVETFFHEFGHVCHQLASDVRFSRFAGTNVERDFVEAPSQMLENWCYEEEPLRLMSGHVDDPSKPLPADIIAKIKAAKIANAGTLTKRQCVLALFDQAIHSRAEVDTAQVYREVCAQHFPGITPTPNTNFAASFGHMAGGYDAQYYSYMWSEVYAADMFYSRFESEGCLNPATGAAYRNEVISRGGSVDAIEMLRNFLGREPNDKAFLKSKGLKVE